MKKVLLDTNALTIPSQFHVDLFGEIKRLVPDAELITLDLVLDELKKLPEREGVKLALQMIDEFGVTVVHGEGKTDDVILEYAEKEKAIVCTNDKELKKACLNKRVPVIFMRKKKLLYLEGE